MKKLTLAFVLWLTAYSSVWAQFDSSHWNFSADLNFYFIPDDFFVLPEFSADKNWLHLEARYNYEDRETFSGWIGYNFKGGNNRNFEYIITPMAGAVVGNSNGMAPGLEMILIYKNFELYTEAEYVLDFNATENNFFYNWTDLLYSPTDWLWLGISGQRTRLYQTSLDIQRGLLVGFGIKNFEITSRLLNIGTDDFFTMLTLSASF